MINTLYRFLLRRASKPSDWKIQAISLPPDARRTLEEAQEAGILKQARMFRMGQFIIGLNLLAREGQNDYVLIIKGENRYPAQDEIEHIAKKLLPSNVIMAQFYPDFHGATLEAPPYSVHLWQLGEFVNIPPDFDLKSLFR